jgi:hypothetical protein
MWGLYPVVGLFGRDSRERWYYTLLMFTGLTFGTISGLFGLSHGRVSQEQDSYIVAAVIANIGCRRWLQEWLLGQRIFFKGLLA